MQKYRKGLLAVGLLIQVVHARPLTQREELLQPEEFALACMKECQFDALFFLPDSARLVHKLMRGLIHQEQKSIKVALFRFTDAELAKALIAAHNRGVVIEVIVDPGALESGHYSKVAQLLKAGIAVYQYQTTDLLPLSKKSSYQTIMHLKTFIFADTIGHQSVIVFGSLNPTHAGFNGNEEVVAVRNAPALVTEFEKHFEKLKKRSSLLSVTDIPARKKKKAALPAATLANGLHKAEKVIRRIVL